MRIGIITQPLGSNYGGVLQNFALQEVLNSLGHTPITLRYNRRTWTWWFKNCLLVTLLKLTGKKGEYMASPASMRRQRQGFEKFISKNIKTSAEFSQYTLALAESLDAIVVGSDQVWRPMYNKLCLYDMFLAFTAGKKIKRLSYAASFGTDKWEYNEQQTRKCAQLLKNFDGVSVREASGVDLCHEHLHCNTAVNVLDPTLLLHRSQYEAVCTHIPQVIKSYLSAYLLDMSDKNKQLVEEIAKQKQLSIKWMSADGDVKPTDTVEAWLASFRDASYVVTDSFHGTVFSIIFQRDFSTIGNKIRGNTRMENLLNMVGLKERLIEQADSLPVINWSQVKTLLDGKRQESINFLQSILR